MIRWYILRKESILRKYLNLLYAGYVKLRKI
jgi:hypothetical protein